MLSKKTIGIIVLAALIVIAVIVLICVLCKKETWTESKINRAENHKVARKTCSRCQQQKDLVKTGKK